MAEVKLTDLRRDLFSYVARVRRGERLQITSRGKVIAEIVAPRHAHRSRVRLGGGCGGSVLRYDRPLEPVFDPAEWDMNR